MYYTENESFNDDSKTEISILLIDMLNAVQLTPGKTETRIEDCRIKKNTGRRRMNYLASLIGFVVGVFTVIVFSKVVYGDVTSRPWWTTIMGMLIWLLVTSFIKGLVDRCDTKQNVLNNGKCPECGIDIKSARERCPECDFLLTQYEGKR
jgi:hypothetical protein